MKKIILLSLALFTITIFLTGCVGESSNLINKIRILKLEDIKSAKIELGRSGSPSAIYSYNINDNEQRKILKNIIDKLNSAKMQGIAEEKGVTNKGQSPTIIIFQLKDGSEIQIKSALKGEITKLKDGTIQATLYDIPNEITVSTNSDDKPIRLLAPEIKDLITDSTKQKAVANSIGYIKNSPYTEKNDINIDEVNIRNANDNTWKSVFTEKGSLNENIVDSTDWVITIGNTSAYKFAVIVCDSKTGEAIGHIPIE
jgi:hypothetical protein